MTPLQCPERLGDKATITAQEAEGIAKYWASNLAKDAQKSVPDRAAPPDGGVEFYIPEFEGAAGGVGGYNANTGRAWWIDRDQDPYDNPENRPLAERCILGLGSTSGPPALPVMYNNLKRIVQTEDSVIIMNEMNHDARVVRMNAEHRPTNSRSWLGGSVGHWEGDTLLVDTINFRDEPGLFGASTDLHVIERFSRIDENTVRYAFTVDDPTWSDSWSGEYP